MGAKNTAIVLVSLPDTNDDTVGTRLPDFLPLAGTVLDSVGSLGSFEK